VLGDRRRRFVERDDGAGVPFDMRAPHTRQGVALKAGALLVGEWKGRSVTALEALIESAAFLILRRRRYPRPSTYR